MLHKLKAIKKSVPLLLVFYLSWATYAQSICRGKAAAPNEKTRSGANELISIIERKPQKSVFGEVKDPNGRPLEGVFVEVFALSKRRGNKEEKIRILACTTDGKGRFCFTKLPTGRYEVLYSMNGGWKHTSLSVVVAPNNRKSLNQKIEVWMQVGT